MTATTTPAPAEMERAFFARDASYDGGFLTGVRTTGIFCRPSCPARRPRRENLEFFGTVEQALAAGYRPCRRCRPLEVDGRNRDGDCAWVSRLRTPLGPMVAAASGKGVCLLEFTDRRRLEAQLATLSRRLRLPLVPGDNDHLRRLRLELDEYLAGRRRAFTVPLLVSGTPFQERVWAELGEIPYGETRSYAEVAQAIGAPKAVRAVGQANGRNRIAIVLPCHRVVNAGGRLGGYGGGLWRKRRLLALEQGQPIGGLLAPPPSGQAMIARTREA
jgi:AraC family transcriptional regulator of adaptative response/methylated-DNA-[protein]-cysteine methyltransferase